MSSEVVEKYCKKYNNPKWLAKQVSQLDREQGVKFLSLMNPSRTVGLCSWNFRRDLRKISQCEDTRAFKSLTQHLDKYIEELNQNNELKFMYQREVDFHRSKLINQSVKISDLYRLTTGDEIMSRMNAARHKSDMVYIPINIRGKVIQHVYLLEHLITSINDGTCLLPSRVQKQIQTKYAMEFASYVNEE